MPDIQIKIPKALKRLLRDVARARSRVELEPSSQQGIGTYAIYRALGRIDEHDGVWEREGRRVELNNPFTIPKSEAADDRPLNIRVPRSIKHAVLDVAEGEETTQRRLLTRWVLDALVAAGYREEVLSMLTNTRVAKAMQVNSEELNGMID